jgi:SM-20-related protein
VNSTFEGIADSIAESGFAVSDQFLTPAEVSDILALNKFQNWLDHFKKAGIGKNQNLHINEAVRGDYIQWIDNNKAPHPLNIYLERLKQLVQFMNQSLFLSLKDFELHLTVYPPGSFYRRHLDQFSRNDHRKLSVICYLNENWNVEQGGQLRMFLPEKVVELLPLTGRLVCFRSDLIEHEVLSATRPRMSITGWILDQHVSLKHF